MRSWVVLWALTGCTAVFGLDAVPNVDRDNDRVVDASDNCPADFNPDQSNFDGDADGDVCDECIDGGAEDVDQDGVLDGCDGCIGSGVDSDKDGVDDACDTCIGAEASGMDVDGDLIDDGCDPCLLGGPHDEDRDGVPDACDNCPGVPNASQGDVMDTSLPDGVGDACDVDPKTGTMQLFDPFLDQRSAWYVQGSGWTIAEDAAVLDTSSSSYRLVGGVQGIFAIRSRVNVTAFYGGALAPAVEVLAADRQLQPAPNMLRCSVDQQGRLTASAINPLGIQSVVSVSQLLDPAAPYTIDLVFTGNAKRLICRLVGQNLVVAMLDVTAPTAVTGWIPGIGATRTKLRFESFNTITSP